MVMLHEEKRNRSQILVHFAEFKFLCKLPIDRAPQVWYNKRGYRDFGGLCDLHKNRPKICANCLLTKIPADAIANGGVKGTVEIFK